MNFEAHQEHRDEFSTGLIALIGACGIYLLIAVLVLFGIAPRMRQLKRAAPVIPISHKAIRPAPIQWQSRKAREALPPKAVPGPTAAQAQPPLPPTQPKPVATPPPPPPVQQTQPVMPPQHRPAPDQTKPLTRLPDAPPLKQLEKKNIAESTAPAVRHEMPSARPISSSARGSEQAQTAPRPLPSRASSRARWFKNEQQPEATSGEYQVSSSETATPFAQSMQQWRDEQRVAGKEQRACRYQENGSLDGDIDGTGTDPHARARFVSLELFYNRFVNIVCDASRTQPMQTGRRTVERHTIIVHLTIDKARHVVELFFAQPSPWDALNSYIERLLRSITPPRLPAEFKGETLTLPLRIRIHLMPEASTITLVPAYD